MPGTHQPTPNVIARYTALPWQVAPWNDRSPVVLLTGSAGGGKSRTAAEKLHGFCLKYPGAMALVTRKVRVSMTKGTVLFFKRTVIGNDPRVRHIESKDYFAYANGSILAYAGLEDEAQRERLKSIGHDGAVDIAWMEEASENEEADFDAVRARMRGKAAPWRQVLLSTNPDAPTHWIKRRLIDGGEARVYFSSEADNPHNPADYKVTLASLRGVELQRLAHGQWVQATGIIFDQWSEANVTEAAAYEPDAGPVLWALDDGYSGAIDEQGNFTPDSHPRAILLCQLRPTGQVVCFAESYAVKRLSDTHIDEVLALPYPAPDYVAHGPGAAEIRGRLQHAGLAPRNAQHPVEEGIKELQRWLAPDANGFRRLVVHPRCRHLRLEFASYRRDASGAIVKQFDHGPDGLRYLCWTLRLQ